MTPVDPVDLDRAHALMMAVLDDECTAEERAELERLLAARPELAAEWARLRRLKEVTTTMALRQPPVEVWDGYRVSVFHRLERSIAWTLVAAGALVLSAWGLWTWLETVLADSSLPALVRIALVAVALGLLLLLLSVARERLVLHRRDPYSKEVTR